MVIGLSHHLYWLLSQSQSSSDLWMLLLCLAQLQALQDKLDNDGLDGVFSKYFDTLKTALFGDVETKIVKEYSSMYDA